MSVAPTRGCSSVGRALESHSRGPGFESPQLHKTEEPAGGSLLTPSGDDGLGRRGAPYTLNNFSDPDRQANIAFALIVLGIIFVGGITIWLFYGAQF